MNLPAVAAALVGLSLLDHGFAGYRAAAGRDGRIFKARFHRRAVRGGLRQGLVTVGTLALVTGAVLGSARAPRALLVDLLGAGEMLCVVFGAYAALVVSAFVPYVFGGMELRCLATVSVFGPMTLLRPVVIAGAGVAAVAVSSDPRSWALVALAVAAHLSAERILDHWIPRFAYGVDRR